MKSAGARLRAISGRLRERWSHFREGKALSLLFDAALILAVFFAVHAWQTRELPLDEIAPETMLALLDGGGPVNALRPGETGISLRPGAATARSASTTWTAWSRTAPSPGARQSRWITVTAKRFRISSTRPASRCRC